MLRQTKVLGIKELVRNFGDIAKAVSGSERADIALEAADVVADRTRANIRAQGLVDRGILEGSVNAFKVNQWTAGVEVTAAHAAAWEYGLKDQPITDRQRSFFWWKFVTTRDNKWRALALSPTYTFVARPYFRPAIQGSLGAAYDAMANKLEQLLERFRI